VKRGNFRLAARINKQLIPVSADIGEVIGLAGADTHESPVIHGQNLATTALGQSGIWSPSGVFLYPSAASGLEIVSADVDDTAAGAGARTVLICYLDATFNVKTETITLNGQTAVPTVALDIYRILYMEVMTAGATGSNEGAITLRVLAGGATREQIPVGFNMSTSCRTTVPVGKVFKLAEWMVGHQELTGSRYRLRSTWNRNAKTVNPGIFKVISTAELLATFFIEKFGTPTCFPAGTDIDVISDNPAATTFAASAQLHGTFLDA
jgi:hypothetical protein